MTGWRLLLAAVTLVGTPLASRGFTLITFDVDGTLVQGGGPSGQAADTGAHSRAYGHAVGRVLGDGGPTPPVADVLPRRDYHGSTDGLILLRLARATLGFEPTESAGRLDELMASMYEYVSDLDDEEVSRGITPLPGVLDALSTLATMKDSVSCGLVTGNVEGIARRKMKAVGILGTGALAPPSDEQLLRNGDWAGAKDIGFLGGFGSDFCSGDIDDADRNHLDRSEQIGIATRRCQASLAAAEAAGGECHTLCRVVHVGDAPADVLAAKAFAESSGTDPNLCIGMVAVATGSYSAAELLKLAGEPCPGRWEPVVLEDGIADPSFLNACGIL